MRQIDVLIPTISDPASILLRAGTGGWELPQFAPDEPHFWQVVAPVNRAAAALGLSATTLRCFTIIDDPAADQFRCYYVLELHGDPPTDPYWHRLAAADLAEFPPVHAEHMNVLQAWINSPPSRIPWYRPGFNADAAEWTTATLTALGRPPVAAVEQLRSWERSALFRTQTPAGPAYTKAAPTVFNHEPALTAALATWIPGCTAAVLARDPARGLFLLDNAGSQSLADLRDPAIWARAIATLAKLQITLTERVDDLLMLGVPDRRIGRFAGWMAELFADEAALRRSPAGLNDSEIVQLRNMQPRLLAALDTLLSGPAPISLEHGDCFPGQFLINGEQTTIIDWSDSSIACPFFSLGFLIEPDSSRPDTIDTLLRNTYLTPWERLLPRPLLETLFDAALLLAPLHHALIYHRTILPAMEHGWEMERMLPYYLRLLLR